MATREQHFTVTRDGVPLSVRRAGTGVPFVWAHGMTSSRAAAAEAGLCDFGTLQDVADVVDYDARGHGRSGGRAAPEDYRWGALAQDLLAVADAAGFDRFVAGGASMGCATTLFAALAAPERMRGLVLAIPPTAWETRAARAGYYEQLAALAERDGLAQLAELARHEPLPRIFAEEFPEYADIGARHLAEMDGAAFAAVMRGAALSDLPNRELIERIEAPALVLAWQDDPGHPMSSAEALAELLPDARLQVARCLADIRAWPEVVRAFLAEV